MDRMLCPIFRRAALAAVVLPLALSLGLAPGCASTHKRDPTAAHAQCLVCKCEGDLACVDVELEPGTPSTEYRGVRYYFCSERCRRDFERDPAAYLQER